MGAQHMLRNKLKLGIAGDVLQLSDALFHAGTGSGSRFEYVDTRNRLHFYVLDRRRDSKGVLSYEVAVRSLDGAGPGKVTLIVGGRRVEWPAVQSESAPDGATISSGTDLSYVEGQKSSPTPSTRYGRPVPPE